MITFHTPENLELLQFNNLSNFKNITHCITTRTGGFSEGPYKSLNLSVNVGDNTEHVIKNRQLITSYFKAKSEKLFIPRQCHTKNVKIINENSLLSDLAETDALITNLKGHIIAVLAADCTPILLFDPTNIIIAAIHAGWKGTVQNIVSSTINQMRDSFNCQPENLYAAIGPCISVEMYEVGEEVALEFRKLFGNNSMIIKAGRIAGKFHINLSEANRNLLIRMGVNPGNIEMTDICTHNHPEWFFSARRDGNQCGRFGSLIMIN